MKNFCEQKSSHYFGNGKYKMLLKIAPSVMFVQQM